MTISTQAFNVDTADGPMRVYEARPSGTPKGGAIVVMEAFGVNDHVEDVARRTAAAGYHAVAPDFFHRSGGGYAAYDDFPKIMEYFKTITDDGILVDVDVALGVLNKAGIDNKKIAIFGFCFGGRVTFLTSARRSLGAGITYYGGGIVNPGGLAGLPALIDEVSYMKTPWMGHFGDLDKSIPVEDVEQLRAEMSARSPIPWELHRYAEADHGFHCEGRPNVYNEAIAKIAWDRTLEFMGTHI